MSVEIPAIPISKKGDFTEIAYYKNYLKKDYFNIDNYRVYGHGGWEYKRYRSPNSPVNFKIMSIGDSFANVPFTFLPLIFTSCDQLDMRHYKNKFDFKEYYSEYNPDIVIVMVNPDSICTENTRYDFFGN